MYRSGAVARRLLPLTPLVHTEKFTSWLTHSSIAPELLRSVTRQYSAAPPPPPQEWGTNILDKIFGFVRNGRK